MVSNLFIFNFNFMINLLKKLTLFMLPLLAVIILYLVIDPFKVIHNDVNTYNDNSNYQVETNRDYQSTELFVSNYKKYNYNSFIFGSSRSYFYKSKSWQKHINGSIFHFNASGETIYGINKKMKFLEELNVEIKNAIIVLDVDVLGTVRNNKGHIFIKHPLTSKESKLMFHVKMFMGFFPKAVIAHTDFYFTQKLKPYMKKYGISAKTVQIDKQTNDFWVFEEDNNISKDSISFYKAKKDIFYKRNGNLIYSKPYIFREQIKLLNEIKSILIKNKTKYKIVISPLYNQEKFAKADLMILKNIFGNNCVYDFSGKNKYTNDYMNYYETSHYRPNIANLIIDSLYSAD